MDFIYSQKQSIQRFQIIKKKKIEKEKNVFKHLFESIIHAIVQLHDRD